MTFRHILLFMCLVSTLGANAQNKKSTTADYTRQIETYRQCFQDKNGDKLKPYLSSDIAFPPFLPKERVSPEGIDNVLKQLFVKHLKSLVVIETKSGKATIAYDISETGKRQSALYFNEEGKITKIELIENLMTEARKRRNGQ